METNRRTVVLSKAELEKLSDNPFKYNRKTTKAHVNSMLKSVSKWGILRNPIIAHVESSNQKYIADGQHLIKAVINSKEAQSIECVEISVNNESGLIQLIADLNTSAKAWGFKEFKDAWLNFGKDNLTLQEYLAYYEVDKVSEKTSLSLALIVDILCKDNKKFKTGKAELSDTTLSTLTYKILDSLKKINCPAHQLYGAKAYIDASYKSKDFDPAKLKYRIESLMGYKDAFIPSNREQFKKYLFGLMDCEENEVKDYIYGKWVSVNSIA